MLTRQICVSGADDCTHEALMSLAEINPDLVLVFASPSHLTGDALNTLQTMQWPQHTRVVGCSTAGEFSQSGVHHMATVITAVHFHHTRMQIAVAEMSTMEETWTTGKQLGEQLACFAPDAVLLLAPGLEINGSALIRGLESVIPETVIFGGLAGDDAAFKHTTVLLDHYTQERAVVAIGLAGQHLRVEAASGGGWTPLGPARVVTQVTDNVLHTLDGKPALDIYRHYLGDYARALPASALLFPLSILDEQGRPGTIRTILGVNEDTGALILAGEVQQGATLQMMYATTDALVSGAQRVAHELVPSGSHGNSLALLVSCVGRKLVMGQRIDEEWEAVASEFGKDVCLTGFFSYGEIGPDRKQASGAELHNQSITITLLREMI